MKRMTLLIVVLTALTMFAVAPVIVMPVQATKIDTLPVDKEAYGIGFVPGETWVTGQVIHQQGSIITWSFDCSVGSGVMVCTTISYEFNLVTSKGHVAQKWVMTVNDGPYGPGVIEGTSTAYFTSPDNAFGTYLAVGNGYLRDCSHVNYFARGAWETIGMIGDLPLVWMYSESGSIKLYS